MSLRYQSICIITFSLKEMKDEWSYGSGYIGVRVIRQKGGMRRLGSVISAVVCIVFIPTMGLMYNTLSSAFGYVKCWKVDGNF